MAIDIRSRLVIVRRIWAHRWVRIAIAVWGVVTAYDTILNQIVPETLGSKFPRVRDFVAMTSGFVPFWGWLLVLAAILTIASLEYAFRRTSKDAVPIRTVSPGLSMGAPPSKAPLAPQRPAATPPATGYAPIPPYVVTLEEKYKEDWEKSPLMLDTLFRLDGNHPRLKFFPDSKERLADSLLLILFAYRKILNVSEVRFSDATAALPISMVNIIYRFSAASGISDSLNAEAIAREKLSHDVERVGLSRGGYLRLTKTGYAHAYEIAHDMIDRA